MGELSKSEHILKADMKIIFKNFKDYTFSDWFQFGLYIGAILGTIAAIIALTQTT